MGGHVTRMRLDGNGERAVPCGRGNSEAKWKGKANEERVSAFALSLNWSNQKAMRHCMRCRKLQALWIVCTHACESVSYACKHCAPRWEGCASRQSVMIVLAVM